MTEPSSKENEQNLGIYDIELGKNVELSAADEQLALDTVLQYDPQAKSIKSVIRSLDSLHLVDLTLEDDAIWQLHMHPIGLIPTLRKLGTNNQGKPLTADIACVYIPLREVGVRIDISLAEIPEVDCGAGYRQLNFNEKIKKNDEWYAGPIERWKKTGESSGNYWPSHSNIGGPYTLMRRKIK